MKKQESILSVKDLSISFQRYENKMQQYELKVMSSLSLKVCRGEIVAIAGSSGSGKSLLAHAIMGLLPDNARISGEIYYKGKKIEQKEKARLRGKEIALVPQSVSFLDPLMKVGKQLWNHRMGKEQIKQQKEIFQRLNLDERIKELYPFQISGGMARKILVSTALLSEADMIIADEPTPGMDLDTAVEALQIFREIADKGKAVLLITHDIDLAFSVADKIAVFYAGTIVEIADSKDFLEGPKALRHPYSRALWKALPQNGFEPIPGFQPYTKELPQGCVFAPRCTLRTAKCQGIISMRELNGGYVRCIHAD